METHGRRVIYANYTEEQLLSGTQEQINDKVLDILKNSVSLHEENAKEIKYLQDYLYGIQDIREKIKLTRTDINNKGVENWAYAFQDWKNTFLLGKPIQYAPLDEGSKEEIEKLNEYTKYEGKAKLDSDLYEDWFTVGRGFRYIQPSAITEEDEAPFDLYNSDVINTEVVYSSSIEHEQLLSFVKTSKQYITQEVNELTGKKEYKPRNYNEYTVYTRNQRFVINDKNTSDLQIVKQELDGKEVYAIPLIPEGHRIIEYYFNKYRMGWLEIGKDIFDDINYCENLDKDDIEAFVNSIMVFTNAEVDEEAMEGIKKFGAVSIKSTDQKKASVELLQSRLKALDTQIYYLRKLNALHSILAVPQANNNGEISNAETGKAILTGQGFTSSSVRVEGEQTSFENCDRRALKTILKICKNMVNSEIKNLKASKVEIRFNRDLTENLLTKTQALINLRSANIPPSVANAIIGLFANPVEVTRLQEEFEKEKRKLEEETNNRNNSNKNIQNQNNKLEDVSSMENQQQ